MESFSLNFLLVPFIKLLSFPFGIHWPSAIMSLGISMLLRLWLRITCWILKSTVFTSSIFKTRTISNFSVKATDFFWVKTTYISAISSIEVVESDSNSGDRFEFNIKSRWERSGDFFKFRNLIRHKYDLKFDICLIVYLSLENKDYEFNIK